MKDGSFFSDQRTKESKIGVEPVSKEDPSSFLCILDAMFRRDKKGNLGEAR